MYYNIYTTEKWLCSFVPDDTNLNSLKNELELLVMQYNGYNPTFYNVTQSREIEMEHPDEYRTWLEFEFQTKTDIEAEAFKSDLETLIHRNFPNAHQFENDMSSNLSEEIVFFEW